MGLISKSLSLPTTVSGIKRFQRIVSVLAANGFAESILQTGITRNIPDLVLPSSIKNDVLTSRGSITWSKSLAKSLRKSFEELGPNFIKLGQVLSTREDLFDEDFISEMKHLQDNVKGIDHASAMSFIEKNLGRPLGEVFSQIEEKPIGQASIGIVYKATLLDGSPVIIKMRRPGIRKIIKADATIFAYILSNLENRIPELKSMGLSQNVYDMLQEIYKETDLLIESRNTTKLKRLIEKNDTNKLVYIPKIYDEYTNHAVLVGEFLDGIPLTKTELVKPKLDLLTKRLEETIIVVLRTMIADDFFHADLHSGNIFLLPDERIGIIDCGLCGSLSKRNAISIITSLSFMVEGNYDELANELLDVCSYESLPDCRQLADELKKVLAPQIGLSITDMDTPQVLQGLAKTLMRHGIRLPSEWNLVFKLISTVEGVGKVYSIQIDFFKLIEENLTEFVGDLYSLKDLKSEAFSLLKSSLITLKLVPRHLRWFLKKTAQNNYALEIKHKDIEKQLDPLSKSLKIAGFMIPASIIIHAGVLVLPKHALENANIAIAMTSVLWSLSAYLLIKGFNNS